MKRGKSKSTSWVVIVICFIIFWPLGLILLLNKLASDRSATLKYGGALSGVAFILIGIGVVYFIMSYTRGSGFMTHAVMFIIGGIFLFITSRRAKIKGERYKKYIDLVVNQSQTSISYIASAVGVSRVTAASDLESMVNAGYFPGAFVSLARGEIVMRGSLSPHDSQHSAPVQTASQASGPVQPTVVSCKSCGANNKALPGQIVECEYCGSPLQGG